MKKLLWILKLKKRKKVVQIWYRWEPIATQTPFFRYFCNLNLIRFPSPARRKARSGDLVFSISMRELESRGLVYTSYTQKASKLLLRASFDAFFIYKFVIWHQNLQQFLFLMLYALNALPVWHQNLQQFLFLMPSVLNNVFPTENKFTPSTSEVNLT